MTKAPVNPLLIEWACARSLRDPQRLTEQFPKLEEWQSGVDQPTLRQLEKLAQFTRTPVGYFFLDKPPEIKVPIPDFRTLGNRQVQDASPDLLDSIYLCQQRQDWFRDYARQTGQGELPFVASLPASSDVVASATTIRKAIGLETTERALLSSWEDALRRLIELVDEAGVLIMISGVVGHNNHRILDPEEFRGFALADPMAPLVFVNGADTKSAQMFTLVHELAHLWLGASGVSDVSPASRPSSQIEQWCNAVAAEVLVPIAAIRSEYRRGSDLSAETLRLTKRFKVSTLVVLRRIHDIGALSIEEYWAAHHAEVARLREILAKRKAEGGGGNFYYTTATRVSKRFAKAVLVSTWEGRASFTEAFRLLGCSNTATLQKLGASLGIG